MNHRHPFKQNTAMVLAFLLTLSAPAFVSCGEQDQSGSTDRVEKPANPMTISARDFHQVYSENPSVAILDVRTRGEYDNFHVKGGKLLPVEEIMSRGQSIEGEIPFDKEETIYVICQTGSRSLTATRILRSMGFTKAVSVNGGHSAFMRMGNTCESGALACR